MILDYMLAHTPLVLVGLTAAAIAATLVAVVIRRARRAMAPRSRDPR